MYGIGSLPMFMWMELGVSGLCVALYFVCASRWEACTLQCCRSSSSASAFRAKITNVSCHTSLTAILQPS